MIEYKIILTKRFKNKLVKIINYCKRNKYSYNKMLTSIYDTVFSLKILPKRYHKISENDYSVVIKNYRIIYSVYDNEQIVYIDSIIHTSQNINR